MIFYMIPQKLSKLYKGTVENVKNMKGHFILNVKLVKKWKDTVEK